VVTTVWIDEPKPDVEDTSESYLIWVVVLLKSRLTGVKLAIWLIVSVMAALTHCLEILRAIISRIVIQVRNRQNNRSFREERRGVVHFDAPVIWM